jgi:hypothetical protein
MRVRVLAILCLLILLMVAPIGCGGRGQSGNGSQGDGGKNDGEKVEKARGGEKMKKERSTPDLTTTSGTVGRVDAEKGLLTLRPEGRGEPMRFRFNADTIEVKVDGQEANPGELSGKKAEVGYFENKSTGNKVARTINAEAPDLTTVSGTLGVVDTEKGRLTLRPEGGGEPMRFRFNADTIEVKVDGQEANPGELSG